MQSNNVVAIGNIPFVYAPLKSADNPPGIPNALPFSLESRDGVISQVRTGKVEETLEKAYSIGSMISGQMDDHGNGKEYADEFLQWIKSQIDLSGKNILEIGCGTGYLLSEINKCGADCIGVEPGESAEYGKKKYKVEIRREFFNPDKFSKKFDYIIFYGVLEHMYSISVFLREVCSILKPRGGGIARSTKL